MPRGGYREGAGRKPLDQNVSPKTFTVFDHQLEYTSEKVRSILDRHAEEYDREWVTLWEDNDGGLWLADAQRTMVWNVGPSTFYDDASALYVNDIDEWKTESYPYADIVEEQDETQLVAEYSDGEVRLYPDAMGASAKEYCFNL